MEVLERTAAAQGERLARAGAAPARRRGAARRAARPRPPRGMRWSVALSLLPGARCCSSAFFVVPLGVLVVTSLADWSGLGFALARVRQLHDDVRATTRSGRRRATRCSTSRAGVFIQVPLGIAGGIILAQRVPGWRIFRSILFVPFVISGAAFALVFATFYNPRYGLLNGALGVVGLDRGQDWLFSTATALPAVAGTFVFILGLVIVLVMAEIAAIPKELYEAAEMDGASALQRQLRITLPLLRNVIGTLVLITLLGYLALFDVVFILTKGGPNDATLTLALYAYRAYVNSAWGFANAVGVVIVLIGLVLIVAVRRLFRLGERTL